MVMALHDSCINYIPAYVFLVSNFIINCPNFKWIIILKMAAIITGSIMRYIITFTTTYIERFGKHVLTKNTLIINGFAPKLTKYSATLSFN